MELFDPVDLVHLPRRAAFRRRVGPLKKPREDLFEDWLEGHRKRAQAPHSDWHWIYTYHWLDARWQKPAPRQPVGLKRSKAMAAVLSRSQPRQYRLRSRE